MIDKNKSWLEARAEILLTHSPRQVDSDRCSMAHFVNRFGNEKRLEQLPNFFELPPATPSEDGAVSLLAMHGNGTIHLKDHKRISKRIQHAAFCGKKLVICLEYSVHIFSSFSEISEQAFENPDHILTSDPWLCGIHVFSNQ